MVRIARSISVGGLLLVLALGSLGMLGGCGGEQRETGTQVEVDMEKQAEQNKQMEQFY